MNLHELLELLSSLLNHDKKTLSFWENQRTLRGKVDAEGLTVKRTEAVRAVADTESWIAWAQSDLSSTVSYLRGINRIVGGNIVINEATRDMYRELAWQSLTQDKAATA